jgi:predicted DNA-binding transcriptional regulator YafY
VLGYYAPIVVVNRKFYCYEDPDYTIAKVPLSSEDLLRLSEAVDLLKQMSASKGFDGVEDVVNRLEDHVASIRYKAAPVIYVESNERLKGLEFMTALHEAIIERTPLAVTYQPFRQPEPMEFLFSPYILKEFRNRWFVFGHRHDSDDRSIINLALDRIECLNESPKGTLYKFNKEFNPKEYFGDIVGVTRNVGEPVHVVFRVEEVDVPYVRTKPLHQSQQEVTTEEDGSVLFSIDVIPNHELERDLLGFGDGITVVSPESLRKKLHERINRSLGHYKLKKRDK